MWGTEAEKIEFAGLYPLFYGNQEERNYAKGIKPIKKLSDNGYVPAVCELGIAYFDHLGVRRNYIEAFKFYMIAAQEGYPSAECGVGNFYAMAFPNHNACENDAAKAAEFWLKASEHGNAGAQCNLASYYLNGTGVHQNPVEAYIWGAMAVHCSSIRFRSAEVFRDQALALLDEEQIIDANGRIEVLKLRLPYEWSEHMIYWRSLHQKYK
ncbi:MAG: hypothetical protein H6Q72_4836 [Firmicutes bacterium]|nr:hypothetical protein [Bacillota bacterium]